MADARADLLGAFDAGSVLTSPQAMAPFLVDWLRSETGAALAVLRPRDVAEVQAMLRHCADHGLGIVPQGGNTGLVGGALPHDADAHVCLSLGRLDRIRAIEPDDYSCVAEAGCVLQAAKEAVAAHDLFLPLTIGSQGSCQIGGVISTNAGGINVLRWGMMREQVLGLEVVLADGTLWDGLTTLRKNNTGPDLKQLFIGAEGTFGIVTAAALRLVPRPTDTASALLALPDLRATMAAFHLARRACSDLLSAFEFLMPTAMAIAREAQPDAPAFTASAGAYVLVELAAPGPVDLSALLTGFLEQAVAAGLVSDALVAASDAQGRRLWTLRESVNEGQVRRGLHMTSDVSVRLSALPGFVVDTCAAIETALPGALAVAYGHFGDGNVHLNVLPPPGSGPEEARSLFHRARAILNAEVDRHGGSISAEHGIGRLKRADHQARLHGPGRTMLRELKQMLDPHGRMNPGALHG